VLAAGRGNRLLPLTERIPKCLLPVGGRSLLEHQLRALQWAGVDRIEIITGHGAERVREVCDGLAGYAHNAQYERTNSLDSLACTTLAPEPDGLLILNSDVLFHPDLLSALLADPRRNVLLADFAATLGEEEMKIRTDGSGRIRAVSKRLSPSAADAENLGLIKLGPPAARALIELARRRNRPRGLRWVPDGLHHLRRRFVFHALPTGDLPWIEIDFPDDLRRAETVIYPRLSASLWGQAAFGGEARRASARPGRASMKT